MTGLKDIISHRSHLSPNRKQSQKRRRKNRSLTIKNIKIEIVNKNLKILRKRRKKRVILRTNQKLNLKNNPMSLPGKVNIKM